MDEFARMKQQVEKRVTESQKKYREESKRRLEGIVEKKIRTGFIGAISAVEDFFGFLWGDDNVALTEDQKKLVELLQRQGFDYDYFERLWQNARTQALNNGNNQIRAIRQELNQYTVNWERYQVQLPVKNPNREEN